MCEDCEWRDFCDMIDEVWDCPDYTPVEDE